MPRLSRRTLARLVAPSIAGVVLGLTSATTTAGAASAVPARAAVQQTELRISVVGNRADLVSGGDALIRIRVPRHDRLALRSVRLGPRDVTRFFESRRVDHSAVGLVSGLRQGRNVLTATLMNGLSARLVITNHPRGGPVFSGPHIQPWVCTTEENGLGQAVDEDCNAPTEITYVYQPQDADPGEYQPYDPESPPDDVAMTRTDQGRRVPYIVRQERGTLNRTIYKAMVLADPNRPWTAQRPQRQWNRKLFVSFAGGCGTPHKQTPHNPDIGIFGNTASDGKLEQPALISRGWMVSGAGLLSYNQNCNEVVSAETVMMMKEELTEGYGPIRRTVSVGGSGGSIQQINMAAAYPGLLDGIVPVVTFPDLWQLVGDATECLLVNQYLASAPHLWPDPADRLAVTGKTGPLACTQFNLFLGDPFDPQNRGFNGLGATVRPGCQLPEEQMYDPHTNPRGARCAVQDYQANIWGRRGPLGAAPVPYDNSGVQYGLRLLERGSISIMQFLDLNEKIGGIDNEGEFTSARSTMDRATARTMYRTGRTTDPHALSRVPILDIREAVLDQDPDGSSDLHQPYNSLMLRARLDAVNGTHANHVYWNVVPENMDIVGALAVDRWLDAIDSDRSRTPLSQKVIRNKPEDIVDTCYIDGEPITDQRRCAQTFPTGTDARIVAGAPLRGDNHKCRLKPLSRSDYTVTFTDAEWTRLRTIFPRGVCDYDRPPVGYRQASTWVSFADGPGGQPLGRAPRSTPMTVRSP